MKILLIFMYIFAFKVYSIIDSTVLVAIGLFLYLIFNKQYRKTFYNFVYKYKKYFIGVTITAILLFLVSLFTPLVHKTFDFSYLKTLFHLYCVMFAGLELVTYLKHKNKLHNIINYIIMAFIIQSVLQLIFFAFPSFSKLFNIFRSKAMIELGSKYHNIRGIALSGSGFFSLASAYGIVFLLYFTKYNTLFKNKIIKILMFCILLTGTFFAGRTGFIALLFIPFLNLRHIKNYFKTRGKKIIFDLGILVLSLTVFFTVTYKVPRIKTVYNYSFELVRNIFNGDGFQTTSTNTLFKMYDVDIDTSTFFIGDGHYNVCKDGKCSYYQDTDVGYLRKILYFGIIGVLLSFVFQIYIFNKNYKNKVNIVLLIFMMILELKGETIGISLMVNSIILMYSLYLLDYSTLKKEKSTDKQNEFIKIDMVNNFLEDKSCDDKVSIIVPIYNAEDYIEQTIDSFLRQTYKNIEIILVDDGSTDNTKNILNDKYGNIKNLKILYQKNLGAPTARNKGLKNSSGKYIIFFDADDYMDNNYILNAIKEFNNCDLLISPYTRLFQDTSKNNIWTFKNKSNLTLSESLYLAPPFPGNKIYLRDIIIENNLKFDNVKVGQDLNFYLKYLQYTKNVKILDKPYVYYRIHDKSISTTYNMNLLDIETSISMAEEFVNESNLDLIKIVRIQHYSTQLLKLQNYKREDALKIKRFFRKSVFKHKLYKINKRYKKAMKKYIIYLLLVLFSPYKVSLKINKYVKESLT